MLLFVGFEVGGFQLALRAVSEEFAVSASGAGLLAAAQSLGIALMPLFFGALSDRIGKKRVLCVFAVVFVLGCALAVLTRGVWGFVLGVFLLGVGSSVCEVAATAALADGYPESSARYINFTQCLFSFGAVISPVLMRRGMDLLGWNWRMNFVISGAAFLCLLPLLLLVPFGGAPTGAAREKTTYRAILGAPAFRLLFCSILLYVGLESGVGFFTESLFALGLGRVDLGAYAISCYWAAMALSRLLYGLLPLKPERTLLAGFGVSAALFVLLALSRVPWLSLAVCALIGFAFGPLWGLLVDLAAKRFPERTGSAVGLMSTGCGLGGVVFPALMGLLANRAGFGLPFLMLTAGALMAGALCYRVFHRRDRA